MPMYDWNGTTGSELGKVYDWDGTTSHQLGKGYDWDGTTNSLIYSAEAVVYENGKFVDDYSSYTAKVVQSSNGSLSLNSDHMLIKCNNGGYCYVGFDKTLTAPEGYTKICLTFIPVNSWNNVNTNAILSENLTDKWANHVKCNQTTANKAVTLTLTLTSLADAFCWGVGSNYDTNISPQIKVKKIWFE